MISDKVNKSPIKQHELTCNAVIRMTIKCTCSSEIQQVAQQLIIVNPTVASAAASVPPIEAGTI